MSTDVERCILDSTNTFLLNFKDVTLLLSELHDMSYESLVGVYDSVSSAIGSCFLSSDFPTVIPDILHCVLVSVAHEISRRRVEVALLNDADPAK